MEQYKLDQSRAIQRLAQSRERIAEELSSYTLNLFFELLLKEKNGKSQDTGTPEKETR